MHQTNKPSGITDRLIRMRHRLEQKASTSDDHNDEPYEPATPATPLHPCPTCCTTFFCSPDHLSFTHTHRTQPIATGPGHQPLTQCVLNQHFREGIRLRNVLRTLYPSPSLPPSQQAPKAGVGTGINSFVRTAGAWTWVPGRTKPWWSSLRGRAWSDEFLEELKEAWPIPPTELLPDPMQALMRSVSEGLSIPMSILWALEVLNGEDTSWTRKRTLRIHVCLSFGGVGGRDL